MSSSDKLPLKISALALDKVQGNLCSEGDKYIEIKTSSTKATGKAKAKNKSFQSVSRK